MRRTDGLTGLLAERRVVSVAETPLAPYSIQMVQGVADNLGRIDQLIDSHAKVAGLDRLPGVDLAIMRAAVWEMVANPDVDDIVAIDEAVAIAKSISTDRSPGFVNAVLDAIRRELESGSAERVTAAIPPAEIPSVDSTADLDDLTELDELLDEY